MEHELNDMLGQAEQSAGVGLTISPEDGLILKVFGSTNQWKVLKRVIDHAVLQWTSGLITQQRSLLEKEQRGRDLERLTGFVHFWTEIKNLIEGEQQGDYEKETIKI